MHANCGPRVTKYLKARCSAVHPIRRHWRVGRSGWPVQADSFLPRTTGGGSSTEGVYYSGCPHFDPPRCVCEICDTTVLATASVWVQASVQPSSISLRAGWPGESAAIKFSSEASLEALAHPRGGGIPVSSSFHLRTTLSEEHPSHQRVDGRREERERQELHRGHTFRKK